MHRLWGTGVPGLYTWEAALSSKDEVADGWQYARGWHNELAVTPDYETAALLLLLQRDMLAISMSRRRSPQSSSAPVSPGLVVAADGGPNLALPVVRSPGNGMGMPCASRCAARSETVRLGTAFPQVPR